MKMAKATTSDMEIIGELVGILNTVIYHGFSPDGSDEMFDKNSLEDLKLFYDKISECMEAAPGGLNRIVLGYNTILDNDLVDPDKDYLDFHPRIKEALEA